MRKNLIKIVALISLAFNLFASDYEWQAFINKEKVYTNEAIHLKYICTINKNSELYAIDFNPRVDNKEVTIKLLGEDTKVESSRKIVSYEFVAFVHKSGVKEFAFETTMKKTTQDSIDNTVIGRDNGKYAEYTKELIKQKKFVIEVEESGSEVVGNLKIDVTKDKTEVKALVPYHLEIALHGIANLSAIKPIDFNIEGVQLFSQAPKISAELTPKGYEGVWSQKFAFVSEKEFTIPQIDIEYFNLETKKIEKLQSNAIDVKVITGYKKEELLDKEEKSFVFNYTYVYYLLIFIAGYLFAKVKFKSKKKLQNREELFCQKISQAKSLEELSIMLVLEDATKYSQLLLEIEKKEHRSLEKVKKLICH